MSTTTNDEKQPQAMGAITRPPGKGNYNEDNDRYDYDGFCNICWKRDFDGIQSVTQHQLKVHTKEDGQLF